MADEPDVDLTKTDPPPLPPDASVPASLPGVASAPARGPLDGVDPKLQEGMASLARSKVAGDENVMEAERGLLNKDRQRLEQQYSATGIEPGEFRKWDADAESSKYRTDPLSKFGSLGSVFGMLASAFTHHPMQNALESSAAAMNAINAGDKEAYDRAHEGWKENMNLVFKRHELEQQRFNDAVTLMHTDMAVGQAQLRENAVRFDDRKMLAMIDAGMIPEIVEYKAKEADTAMKMRIAYDEIEKSGIAGEWRKRQMDQLPDDIKNDPVKLAGAKQHILQSSELINSKNVDQQALGNWQAKYLREHGEPPPDEAVIAKIRELSSAKWAGHGSQNADQQFIAKFYEEHPQATSDEFTKAFGEFKRSQKAPAGAGAGSGGTIGAQQKAKKWEDVHADVVQEHPDWTAGKQDIETDRRMKEGTQVLSSKQKDDLLHQIGVEDRGIEVINKTEDLLKKHTGISGFGGKIGRPTETFAQILGSKSTAYHEFSSYINLLKEWEKGMLANAKITGRQLKASEERADQIIPGLNLGDTSVRVMEQLNQVKELMRQIREEDSARLKGEFTPEMSQQITGTGKKGSGGASWRFLAIPAGP